MSRRDDAAAATVVVPDVDRVFKKPNRTASRAKPFTKSDYLGEG